jgi:hypothetical protein
MTREEFLESIVKEREYQEEKWGNEFDNFNTPNDWIVYICRYAGMASTGERSFHEAMTKVAALACAAVETYERNNGLEPRHYDKTEMFVG